MAYEGLNSGVIIPLGEMGVRIFSHFTVQAVIGQRHFLVTRVLWVGLKNSFSLTD